MFSSFIEALPEKVRSTNDFHHGTKFRGKDKAIGCMYVELNQLYKKYIAFDIDDQTAYSLWQEKNLPPPTYIVINKVNGHGHYLYEIRTPVYYTENAHRAPQKYFEATDIALTNLLGADLDYVGHFVKNPLHPYWITYYHPHAVYDLEDFKEWGVDLRGHKRKQVLRESVEGRNTTLFDTLRLWAYQDVLKQGSYVDFQQGVDDKALGINGMFLDCEKGILPVKEVLSTARSVGTWTWRHKDSIGTQKNRGVMELPADMSKKAKQAAGATYSAAEKTKGTKEAVVQAAVALRAAGTPVTQESVAIRANVSVPSVRRYWGDVDAQLGLYKKCA